MEGVAENGLVLGHVRGGNDADKLGHGGGVWGRWDGEKTVGGAGGAEKEKRTDKICFQSG